MEAKSTESRKRRSVSRETSYFSRETMFILADTAASIYNSPPRLISQKEVHILEDSG